MTNYVHFQTQITTIMEIMTKTAIAEITKLFNDSSSVLGLKISRSLHDNEVLEKKLQLLHHELKTARDHKIKSARESPVNTRSVGVQVLVEEPCRERGFGQEWSFSPRRDGEPAGVEQFANMEKVRPEPVLIKEETLEENLCYRDHTPETEKRVTLPTTVEDWKKLDTEPTPAGDLEELSEQHRFEHGDEELSGLEFVVKAEQEEENVAQRLNQTGCEHSAGGLNNLGSDYVMYERDSHLWTSFTQRYNNMETDDPVCSNTTEQCSQSLPIHTQLQHAPAIVEFSRNTLSSFGASYVEFDKMSEKSSVCSEELRSEAIPTQQGQYRERRVHTVERENQTLLPQQQQHGPSVKHMRGSESPAQPHSGSQYETGSTLSTSVLNAGNEGKIDGQADFGKNPFICGRSFDHGSHLMAHNPIHIGEKPFICTQCGKSFSHKCNLVQHERVHSGHKPFVCAQCGKRFSRGANFRAHQRIHTGEKPYQCTQCGKRFAWDANLRAHHRSHQGERPHHCTQCGKCFVRRRSLVSHQRIHTTVV